MNYSGQISGQNCFKARNYGTFHRALNSKKCVNFCKALEWRLWGMRKRIIIVLTIIIFIGCFINTNNSNNSSLIGAYIDGEYASNIPSKDDGYVVEKIVCDNEANATWDYKSWGLLLTNVKKKAKCNVYFTKDDIVNSIKANLDTTGKCPVVDDTGKTKLSGPETENALICSIPDDYGTSYYYRGPVKNNYVYFAGYYWRIMRINGDGSIRMIYDGTMAHENSESTEDKIIGYSAFNDKSGDNAYVGYMYGTPNSSTYEETHRNINSSTIKSYLDDWYVKNLENKNDFIADNIFCNDRTIHGYSGSEYINTKLGYSNNSTYYRWAFAIYGDDTYNAYNYLFCTNKNDSFTVSDKIHGNGDLSYAIGLISKDELLLAGGWGERELENIKKLYFYTGIAYWTISPHWVGSIGNATGDYVAMGSLSKDSDTNMSISILEKLGVKPVINLKHNALKLGDGTITNADRVS